MTLAGLHALTTDSLEVDIKSKGLEIHTKNIWKYVLPPVTTKLTKVNKKTSIALALVLWKDHDA